MKKLGKKTGFWVPISCSVGGEKDLIKLPPIICFTFSSYSGMASSGKEYKVIEVFLLPFLSFPEPNLPFQTIYD